MQGRRKVWKSGGLVVLGGDNVLPGRDRVKMICQKLGGGAALSHACILIIIQQLKYMYNANCNSSTYVARI